MNITKKVEITKDIEATSDILCNSCGESIMIDGSPAILKGIDVGLYFGYGSVYDNELHRFDLCDDCYGAIIADFVIPVTIE